MIETIIVILFAIGIAAAIYYFLKKASTLVVNAVVGLIALFVVNQLNILGMGDVPITWVSVVVCAFGGLPGAALLIVLNLVGITL
jgi:hypothetical protein